MAITDDRDVRDAIWYATDAISNRLVNDSMFIEKVKNSTEDLKDCCYDVDCYRVRELIDKVSKHYNDKYSKEEYGMTGSEFKKIENDIRIINGNISLTFDGECDIAHIYVPLNYLKCFDIKMPTTDFCVSKRKDTGNWIEGLPAIKKIETYNDRVTKVTFIDDTFTKSVCSENDHFDEDVGITICCMKRLFGKDGNRMYNDMIRKAHKVIDENNKKKEAEVKEEAERKLRAKKAACNKAARKLLKKQEQIDIQAQAIIKAHRMLEDEQREEGLI